MTGDGVVQSGRGGGAGGGLDGSGLPRPYTVRTFQARVADFDKLINNITLRDQEGTPEERRQQITENLRFDQFGESVRALFGADVHNSDLKVIYKKISTNPDANIDWSELFGYLNTGSEDSHVTVGEEVNVFAIPARRRLGDAAGDRKRRDIAVCIKYVPSTDVYLSASQKGVVSVWSSKYRLQACTELTDSAWLTGCDYLPNIRRAVVCTERSICVWDHRSKGKNQQTFVIKPIEDPPQCMTWLPLASQGPQEDSLLYGDDQGYVNLLTLSMRDFNVRITKEDRKQSAAQSHVVDPHKLTNPIRRRKLHKDWVLKVKWFPELRCFASCSPSATSSFVLTDIETFLDDTIQIKPVAVPKGVNAFDHCARANVIATGGVDKIIRVWHPHIFSRPTGKLVGHLFTIVDIVCNEKDQHIISLSTARVVRVWDIHTLTSLQVFTDNEDRPGEKRIYSLLYDNKHEVLLTGSSVIDAWPLTRSVQDTLQVPHTHDRPISQVLENVELNQVVTVCTESIIRIWDSDSGKAVTHIPEPHGPGVELTALTFDESGYRMATGAVDGSVKVWDFGSGQEIKCRAGRPGREDLAVLALHYCHLPENDRCLLALGWGNKLRILLDSNETKELQVLCDFNDVRYLSREMTLTGSRDTLSKASPLPDIGSTRATAAITNVFKKDYILDAHEVLCTAVLQPHLLATGCTDGSLILWNIQKSMLESVFSLPVDRSAEEEGSKFVRTMSDDNVRGVNVVRFLVHTTRRPDPQHQRRMEKSDDTDVTVGDDDVTRGQTPRCDTPPAGSYTRSTRGSIQSVRRNIVIDRALLEELSSVGVEMDVGVETDSMATGQPTSTKKPLAGNSTSESIRSSQPEAAENPEVRAHQEVTDSSDTDAPPGASAGQTETDPETPMAVEEGDPDGHTTEDGNLAGRADPDGDMLVETFDPILVTCHQDSFIRFWSLEGELLKEITAVTRRQGSAVTALCHDRDVTVIVTGDSRGYMTLWDVGNFLQDPTSQDMNSIKQTLCWRGHLTKVVSLEYINSAQLIVSGSTDGSVRVWWGPKARYVGFYGQSREFNLASGQQTVSTPVLPYDISEGPLAPVQSMNERQAMNVEDRKFQYPLVFDNQKWKPFRRSAYVSERTKPKAAVSNSKFFDALMKPKPSNKDLDSFTTGDVQQGAVYRALPVYRIFTPTRLKSPDLSYPPTEGSVFTRSLPLGHPGTGKGHKSGMRSKRDGEKRSIAHKLRPSRTSYMHAVAPPGRYAASSPSVATSSVTAGSPRKR